MRWRGKPHQCISCTTGSLRRPLRGTCGAKEQLCKTSSPDITNGGGMQTETDAQSGQVARGFPTVPNGLGAFPSFLKQKLQDPATRLRRGRAVVEFPCQKRGRFFRTEAQPEFRSTVFRLYNSRTCDGTNPGRATAVKRLQQEKLKFHTHASRLGVPGTN